MSNLPADKGVPPAVSAADTCGIGPGRLGYDTMTERDKSGRLADGTDPLVGTRVQRCYPHDGSPRAGKRRGPILRITALKEWRPADGPPVPRAWATLANVKTGGRAGGEYVWNLRRAYGHQPKPGESDMPRMRVRGEGAEPGTMKPLVSSIRIGNELRERLLERGGEISTTIRRDLNRLYDLLDETRSRLRFPPGTLASLAEAWAIAAPPPPHDTLRPSWFMPVLLNACGRMGTPAAKALADFIGTWTPLDALTVQDVVERYAPEEADRARFAHRGLQEGPPHASGSPQKPGGGSSREKLDDSPSRAS